MFRSATNRFLKPVSRRLSYHVRTRRDSLLMRRDHLAMLLLLTIVITALVSMLLPARQASEALHHRVDTLYRPHPGSQTGALPKGVADMQMSIPQELKVANTVETMARQMGLLCARLAQLETLGFELQELAGLDSGEFNFAAVGCRDDRSTPLFVVPTSASGSSKTAASPEAPVGVQGSVNFDADDLTGQLSLLKTGIAHIDTQLGAMREIFTDRKAASGSMPSGSPLFGSTDANITSRFGYRKKLIGAAHGKAMRFHHGLDLGAPYGSAILAMGAGIITYSGKNGKYGNLVEIDHGNGFVSRYGHNSENLVEVGAMVRRGQMIARVGSTGLSTGPHVHVEVLSHGKAIDPELVVKLPKSHQG